MNMQVIQSIQNKIYEMRNERVMLDYDLAALYEVETKVFNQTVKRNIKRFPADFMFRLTRQEWNNIKALVTPQYTEKQSITASRLPITLPLSSPGRGETCEITSPLQLKEGYLEISYVCSTPLLIFVHWPYGLSPPA